ncbi:MAG: DUF2182 domain-containing protein [Pseudolabrys sp.]|nr:DUF2182 domain-containing protein [Pseudolabrys sp.]
MIGLTALGWLWLGLLAAPQLGLWEMLCGSHSAFSPADAPLLIAMWSAMALAMMIPSAAPMVLTYAEIADTAARQRQHVVSPLVLAAGYIVVWFGFACAIAGAQILLSQWNASNSVTALSRGVSGAAFIAAGLYQFSALKSACLRLCRQPFQFFFTNWKTTPSGVFTLGLKQGAHCLGCCWAMMLTMLALGAMNLVWMVALAAAMTIEKMSGPRFSRGLGVTLIVIGAGFVVSAFWSL